MKHIRQIALFIALGLIALTIQAQSSVKPDKKWLDSKFSMFIHWGLYSELGGVWNGKNVERGYSEQIQSFAGIWSDYYERVAHGFKPDKWNADSIALLAKMAGMRSIVFTSKHHDGFSMYRTKYSDFNIVDATPFKRDVMRELSEACQRHDIGFGVYYSLIDWHFPEAYPMSSHNADKVTMAHHQYSMKQVEEILTNYGTITELWFDMGSLTEQQSTELYDLVTRLQPSCMVSGRIGNNKGDFAVMGDNQIPDYKIAMPWQTPASMFNETWGYRSWQKRDDIDKKIEDKIRSLVTVVARGGNYLLNIGPRGDGSVVEYEQEVLMAMGEWMSKYGEAVYGTESIPTYKVPQWGEMTVKGDKLYLFINNLPSDNKVTIERLSGKIKNGRILGDSGAGKLKIKGTTITIPTTAKPDRGYIVVELSFSKGFDFTPEKVALPQKETSSLLLTSNNGTPIYSFSFIDYYRSKKIVAGYEWYFSQGVATNPKIEISLDGISLENKSVQVLINDVPMLFRMDDSGTKIIIDTISLAKSNIQRCVVFTMAKICSI